MIAISGLLVVVAFVTLIVGVFQNGLSLIYVSIAASLAAAVSLGMGVVRGRPKAVAVAGSETLGTWGGTATPVLDRPAEDTYTDEAPVTALEDEPTTQVLRLDEPEEAEAAPEAPARSRSTGSRARKTTAAKSTSRASAQTVVVVPGRDKFHKETCRYAKGQVTQSMTKAEAKKEGYVACGVCKP